MEYFEVRTAPLNDMQERAEGEMGLHTGETKREIYSRFGAVCRPVLHFPPILW